MRGSLKVREVVSTIHLVAKGENALPSKVSDGILIPDI
jgi:hypothetical protein